MKHTNFKSKLMALAVVVSFALAVGCSTTQQSEATRSTGEIAGSVQVAGKPLAGATVTLFAAGTGTPEKLSEARTDDQGTFKLDARHASGDRVLYVVAKGANENVALLSVLGSTPPPTITVNELTTVASAFTTARFIDGEAISGNPLGLRIAAGNAPNLVDPATGKWGKVLMDPINSTQTATLSTLDTLASLISACATVGDDAWRARFYKAATPDGWATPKNTFEAMAGIAREPWNNASELYALFDAAYPQPADGSRRTAPFVPYLAWTPPDFTLSLCFAGGGVFANGRFMFDADGNLWSGQNWMPGSQSGVLRNIGGGVVKFSPNGVPLSPPITGFTGMGLDGVGWGTAVTRDKVWATSFNGKILVMDLDGKPIGDESIFPFKEKLFGLMGVGVAANGDVWIADGPGNQLVFFPGGRVKEGKIVKYPGANSPFDVVIDSKNRVWVANSGSDTVTRFSADDPTKVETFRCGISVRGLALDANENVWVASCCSLDFKMPPVPDGASIMEQFKIMVRAAMADPKPTGVVNMIRPDGTQSAPMGFDGSGAINIPWGLNIDGNGDVWVGDFKSRSVALLAGDDTKGHPAGTKTGDLIHAFTGGSIQMLTDVSIDPAGNVWAANNWNFPEAGAMDNPAYATSTWGGGSGFTVIYGVAAPVKPPRMGAVKTY